MKPPNCPNQPNLLVDASMPEYGILVIGRAGRLCYLPLLLVEGEMDPWPHNDEFSILGFHGEQAEEFAWNFLRSQHAVYHEE